jgi:riboflavin synthase
MFTGIVEEVGTLLRVESTGLVISTPSGLSDVECKDSVAVDGTCLTVIDRGSDWFHVHTIPETLRCTRLGTLQPGARVNLERSLAANQRIGGHMVQGHIEATVRVLFTRDDGIERYCEAELPSPLRAYVVPKCFVALNGVSLTVIDRQHDSFSFALIPYTREHTNLGETEPGMLLNLETDIIGRYVAHMLNQRGELKDDVDESRALDASSMPTLTTSPFEYARGSLLQRSLYAVTNGI